MGQTQAVINRRGERVDRKAGLETLLIGNSEREIHLEPDNLALHLIQHIRDESHNHAISGHRKTAESVYSERFGEY